MSRNPLGVMAGLVFGAALWLSGCGAKQEPPPAASDAVTEFTIEVPAAGESTAAPAATGETAPVSSPEPATSPATEPPPAETQP